MNRELLLKPTVNELSAREQLLIDIAKERYQADPWHTENHANYSPDVHPVLKGFCLDKSRQKAYPVYETDNGLFAIDHRPEAHEVSSWAVRPVDVYSL